MTGEKFSQQPTISAAVNIHRPVPMPGTSGANLLERRTILAMSALAGVSLLTFGQAASATSTRRQAGSVGKRVLTIPPGNPIFGASQASFEKFGYSPAVWAKGLLFIAGQVGIRPDGTVPDTAAEQTEWALRRLSEILRLAKLSPSDLVDVVSYHRDLPQNIEAFLSAKAKFMARPFPAWSIIGVKALGRPTLEVEIQAIAAVR